MADLNHSSLRRGRSADDTAPQQKHYSSVSASIGPQGQNKKPFVPKPFGPMNTHTAKNIPDTLYTTQVRLRKVGDILTFIGSDPHGVPKSAEEFQKAIENLSFRNPLVLTYSSKSEAEYFTSKHGENGKVYSISTKGLKPGTVFENPLNDGQFVFLHHVPYNHIDANNEQKLTATSKPKQPILVEDSEDEHDSGDDYLSDSAPCHHCGRPPLSKKRKVTFAEDTITGKRSHETNIQDAPSRKRTASVDEDELSIPKKKRKVQTAVPSKGAAAAKKSEPDNSKKVEKTQNAPTNKTTLSTKNSEPNNTKKLEKAQTTSINKTTSSAKDSESNDSKKRKIAQTSESAAVEEDSQPDKTKKRKITNTDESAAAAEESEPDNSKKRKTAKTAPKARQVKAKVPIAAEPITEAQLVTEAKPESIITSEPAKSSRAARAERLSEKRGTSTSKPAKAASFTENVRTTRAITKAAVKKQDPATTEKKQAAVIAKTFDRSKNGRFKSAANNTTGTAETPMQSQVSQDSDTKMPSNKPETSSGIQTQFPSSGGSEKTASEKVPAKKGPSKKHSSGKSLPEIILSEETATGEILSKKILPKKKAISKKITSNKTTSDMAASYLESFTDDHVYSITESTTFAAATGCMITPEEKHSTINGALTTPKIDANTTFNNSTTLLSSPPLHSIAQPSSKMNQETDIQKRKAEDQHRHPFDPSYMAPRILDDPIIYSPYDPVQKTDMKRIIYEHVWYSKEGQERRYLVEWKDELDGGIGRRPKWVGINACAPKLLKDFAMTKLLWRTTRQNDTLPSQELLFIDRDALLLDEKTHGGMYVDYGYGQIPMWERYSCPKIRSEQIAAYTAKEKLWADFEHAAAGGGKKKL